MRSRNRFRVRFSVSRQKHKRVSCCRLIYTCLSNALERSNWLSVIAEDEDIYNNISFILKSSTNRKDGGVKW